MSTLHEDELSKHSSLPKISSQKLFISLQLGHKWTKFSINNKLFYYCFVMYDKANVPLIA